MGKIKDFFAGLQLSPEIANAVKEADEAYEDLAARYSVKIGTQPIVDPEAETVLIRQVDELEIKILGAIYDLEDVAVIERITQTLQMDKLVVENGINNLMKKIWINLRYKRIYRKQLQVYHLTSEGVRILNEIRNGS